MISLTILAMVFVLIAARQTLGVRLQIWQIMCLGALAVLLTGQISPAAALRAINLDVMLFLFGMFIVGQGLEESGYLGCLAYRAFKRAATADRLLLLVLFGMGGLSAILMNDTVAIIGTPVVLHLARQHKISPKLLLLALAFAITTGSVTSPIGNPQNLLIAINGGIPNPFVTFFKYLALPTLLNLFLTYLWLKLAYGKGSPDGLLHHSQEPVKDHHLAVLSKVSLLLLVIMVFVKIISVFWDARLDLKLTYIALLAALPILLLSPRRLDVIKRADWHTLLFFAGMFVLMESVWDTGFFQSILERFNVNIASLGMIFAVSVFLSQLISNVPVVALYLPMLHQAGATVAGMVALAAGSTIAGNLLVLGAASNVIIIQNAEKKGETLTFGEFAKVGAPLTAVHVAVYAVFLLILD